MRAIQRARLWAITWTASQAPLAAKRPEGEMVEPDAVLEVSDGILDLGVASMVGLQFQGIPLPVGDEGVIAVVDEEGQLRAWGGLHPPDDEAHRCGAGLTLEGSVELVSEVFDLTNVVLKIASCCGRKLIENTIPYPSPPIVRISLWS